jgi:phosphatidylinositol phospholipase C delta
MARLLREILGSLLYIPELHDFSSDSLPSPFELRGKVIIKGKRHAQEELGEDEEDDDVEEKAMAQDEIKRVKVNVIPELAKLTLIEGAKFKSIEQSLTLHPTMMHSLSEHKIGKLLKQTDTNRLLLRKLNASHITRIYPMGIRVDSSNLNPLPSWATGCQMIALNLQGQDSALILNDGRFRENGGCGYIQKPFGLLRDDDDDSLRMDCKPVTLRIKILSGLCLPKPAGLKKGEIIDSYVNLSMYDVNLGNGSGALECTTHHATKMIRDNVFSPVWNEKQFTEFNVFSPDVAMLVFKVMDQDVGRDDEVCYNAIPVSSLRPGIRSVEFFDKHSNRWGPFNFATLLVEILVD